MNAIDFRAMFPVFDNLDNSIIELWAEVAGEHLKSSWVLNGKRFQIALNLMTAHLLHLSVWTEGNNSGAAQNGSIVASASEGSVSVSFATPPTKNAWQHWLASSPYGLQLWALLKQWSASGFYIGGLPERKAVRKVGGVFV